MSEKKRNLDANESVSVAPSQRQQSKTARQAAQDDSFLRYMKKNYFEHFRRVSAWRRAARWALFSYPLFSGILIAAPFLLSMLVLKKLYAQPPEWFNNFLSPETSSFVMPAILAVSGIAFVFGLLLGVGLGVSRARLLNFEAERTELNVRQSYFLRRIAKTQRVSRRRKMSY